MRLSIHQFKYLILVIICIYVLSGCFAERPEIEEVSNNISLSEEQNTVLISHYEKLFELYEANEVYSKEEEIDIRSEIIELSRNETDEKLQSIYLEYSGVYLMVVNLNRYQEGSMVTKESWKPDINESMNLIYDFLVDNCNYDGKQFNLDN